MDRWKDELIAASTSLRHSSKAIDLKLMCDLINSSTLRFRRSLRLFDAGWYGSTITFFILKKSHEAVNNLLLNSVPFSVTRQREHLSLRFSL